jgi:hypothetical protein
LLLLLPLFITSLSAQDTPTNVSSLVDQNSNIVANNSNPVNQISNDLNEKHDDTPSVSIGKEVDIAGVSNIHFHLTVPRYYSPYEEVPFLYFVNSSTTNYIDQEKHYFSLHMGSNPFSPSYGLLLSNLTAGSYSCHIGRAYNKTWSVRIRYHS